ncbi:MAG TPA: arginine--tRNA ligase [Acidimicrobiales bacterium]|nr:arginine--tRNA ligase [Acidimicrobiales bacterium]
MADLLSVLAPRFEAAISAAFGIEADPVLRASTQGGVDVQANAAMALGKQLGRPPREIANEVVAALDVADIASNVEVAGAGFINVTLKDEFIASIATDALTIAGTDPQTVVIDYSQPNVAKEMHVGHLRSTIIGDAIARVLGYLGHRVIRQNHIGDWGTNFGMLIEHMLDVGETEAAHELSLGDLERFYREANAKFGADEAFKERARSRVVALQSGDAETIRLWHLLIDESERYFTQVYERLNVLLTPDDVVGESFYNPMLDDVAAELETKGLAVIDDGALCVFPPGFVGRDGKAFPLMVRKSDGGYGYDATDLAALRYRVRDLHGDRLVYVVDARQSQHFALLFAAGEMAGWLDGAHRAEHVPFGSVLGADGKPLKTRAGNNVKLIELLDEAVARAEGVVAEKNPDLPAAARAEVARMVGIGAVKYADLSNDRVKDYVFDFERMLAFEGNTAPYLQYAHARIRSIFRRAEVTAASGSITIGTPEERSLAVALAGFEPAVVATAESLQPHRLATYLFDLAQTFTAFYEACPILRAEDDATCQSRLALADLTARTLATGLDLLGIEVPDQM